MGEVVTVMLECDRCGSEHNKVKFLASNEHGETHLQWRINAGNVAPVANQEGRAWLCTECTGEFLTFMQWKGKV